MIYIFDIDSTIANNDHRAAYLEKHCTSCGRVPLDPHHHRPKCVCGGEEFTITQASWDKFLDPDLMFQDTPIPKAQEALEVLCESGANLHFLTGRNEGLRDLTMRWLYTHFPCLEQKEFLLMMRPLDQKSVPASEYKRQKIETLYELWSLPWKRPFIFFDDDPFVLGMMREYGLVFKAPECWEFFNPEPPDGKEAAKCR